MRKVPENNSLKKEIRKLLELCKKDEKDNGEKRNYFNAPITEEEMINWEERNRAKIPESYKEWLRFSGKCCIAGNTATFWGPNEFHSDYVPKGLVVIEKWYAFQRMKAFLYGYLKEKQQSLMILRVFLRK